VNVKKKNGGMNPPIKWPQVSAFRLARHHLAGETQADLITVVRSASGIQSQVMSCAERALWARMHGLTRGEIQSALYKSRTLVRTSCMRQTLHLIPSEDFSIYISALKKSRREALMRIICKFGVTAKDVDLLNKAVMEALSPGPVTQSRLTELIKPRVGKRVRSWMQRVWSVFRSAIVEGLICYGPSRGQEVTFVRVDQWLSQTRTVNELEAKQILLRCYLSAYGPATIQDFSKWSGISMGEAREIWQALESELLELSIEETNASILRKDYEALKNSHLRRPILRLLPSFDPFLLAHAEKNHLVDPRNYKHVYRNQGWISPVVMLDGRVIGIWSLKGRGPQRLMEVEPFNRISGVIKDSIEEEALGLGGFLETPIEVRFNR
jgi:hypothetical protein